jgi:hypothetical protein
MWIREDTGHGRNSSLSRKWGALRIPSLSGQGGRRARNKEIQWETQKDDAADLGVNLLLKDNHAVVVCAAGKKAKCDVARPKKKKKFMPHTRLTQLEMRRRGPKVTGSLRSSIGALGKERQRPLGHALSATTAGVRDRGPRLAASG